LSQIETVIRASKQLEQLLERHYGASGRGLHEKTSSIEDQLDSDTVRRLRKIATLRNKVVHEDFEIDDLTDFQCDAEDLAQQLQPKSAIKTSKSKNSTAKNSPAKSNQSPNSVARPTPETRPTVKKPSTTESAKQPPQKTGPNKTLTPQPRVQPRVKLASKNQPTQVRNTQTATTRPQSSSLLPTVSGILIFLAIIWILAH